MRRGLPPSHARAHAEVQIAPSATAVSSPFFLIVRPKLIATLKEPPGLSKKTMADRMAPSVSRSFPSSPSFSLPLMVIHQGGAWRDDVRAA